MMLDRRLMITTILRTILKLQRQATAHISLDSTRMSATFKKMIQTRGFSDNNSDGITSAKMEVNGVQIHYETAGKGDHHVLLLPGAIGSTRTDFEAQLLTMNRDKFTVIAMDPRGYGKSIPPERDWPLEYHSRDADDAITLVKKLGISRISLIGWSDGAVVAMMMAARSPDLIHSIAQWGGNAYVIEEDVIQFDALGLNDINNWSSKMKRPFLELYGETYFMKIWKEWYVAYCAYLTHRNGDMCVGEIANIQCPTLIIHGANDPIVLMEHPEYLHKHIRNSRFVLMPDASHNLHIQFTKEFNELVEDFFIEHSDSSSTNAT